MELSRTVDVRRRPKVTLPSRFVLGALMVVASLLSARGAGSSTLISLPTHNDLNGYPTALLEATLVRDGPCLYAEGLDDAGRWLPIWPVGFALDAEVVVNGSERMGMLGDHLKLAGGEYHESQYGFLRTLMPADVPAACRGGEYWLVSGMQ
jgi:hypothetical protein